MRRIKDTFTDRKMRYLLCIGLVFALCMVLPLTARAEDDDDDAFYYKEYENEETGYTAVLYDEADVLKESDESKILDRLTEITKYGNAVFYSAEGSSQVSGSQASQMAGRFFEQRFGSHADGVIVAEIMFTDGSGKCMLWIETYNSLYGKVKPSDCDSIADNAVSKHSGDGIPVRFCRIPSKQLH